MLRRTGILICLISLFSTGIFAQNGILRGYVYNKEDGEVFQAADVFLEGTGYGTNTDESGFFNISDVPPGDYTLIATFTGYDSAIEKVTVKNGSISTFTFFIQESSVNLGTVDINADYQDRITQIGVSNVKITPEQIKRLPSAGGEPDLAQYLQVIPGVIYTGDQGGQLYIRGGSPIQTKVLLDGMTIYNPFHSIGFFSVFETDFIRDVDVFTGGFGAEYGDRISAVVDIATIDGNKTKTEGKISVSPFMGKVLLQGPIKKIDIENKQYNSISYILATKHSWLDQTSKSLYNYVDTNGIPYTFTDVYGKITFTGKNSSKFKLFGFNFDDEVTFGSGTNFDWVSRGGGAAFTVIPGGRRMLIDGRFSYSDYQMQFLETADADPRTSKIGGFDMGVAFTYYIPDGEAKYGIEVNGFETDFKFFNSNGIIIEEQQFTTELSGYVKVRKIFNEKFIFEPSLRIQWYASLFDISPEPRLGLKWNVNPRFRLKASGGMYSQNLISTKSDRDVVNLFTGFLSGPDDKLFTVDGDVAPDVLQKAIHGIFGLEFDINEYMELNAETYYKKFTQLINFNRSKQQVTDPTYIIENGDAYGFDLLVNYENDQWFFWVAYSLGFITRDNGDQVYPPHYDRRHNVNLLGSYTFGKDRTWETSVRWNLGSGFPFTKTQGFYEYLDFGDGIGTDYTTANGDIGIIYSETINGGRLPYYHRLDYSIKKKINFTKNIEGELIGSVTNVYNRENIFYFDRVRYSRVNQLPILPSVAFNLSF